ncbi:MAG: bacillithiol biosynthesis protein BshC, partial [Luteibaculum sp.]
LNADQKELKHLFAPIIRKELESNFVETQVSETITSFPDELKVQAKPRPCNFFLFKAGKRLRIDREKDHFTLHPSGEKISKQELLDLLENSPEAFSPNVLTRPLYQEYILPNLAYVGGGGELAYWLQLKNMFQDAGLSFPHLILRNTFQLVDSGVAKKLQKLNITAEEIFLDEQLLINQHLAETQDTELIDFGAELRKKEEWIVSIEKKVKAIDPTLVSSVEAQSKNFEKFLDSLSKKLKKRLKDRQETEINQIASVKERLFPEGKLQERSENVLHYLAKHGFSFFDLILQESGGLNSTCKVIYLP